MSLLELKPISSQMLSAVLELDQLCFGGLWTLEGYQRELNSPNSALLGLFVGNSQPAERKTSEGKITNYQLPITLNSDFRTDAASSVSTSTSEFLAMGCFWAILDEAHITLLAVHPQYQHQGLGQAMLIGLLAQAHDRGLERATLEVRVSNQPAISLYKKFGFQIAGRRRGYYKDTNEDALILWHGGLGEPEFPSTLATWCKTVTDRLAIAGWNFNLIHNS